MCNELRGDLGQGVTLLSMVSRQRERLDTTSARDAIAVEIKKLIEANPQFQDKLEFPSFENPRLLVLINQRCCIRFEFGLLLISQVTPVSWHLSDATLCMKVVQRLLLAIRNFCL